MSPLLTVPEVAVMLRVRPNTIYTWIGREILIPEFGLRKLGVATRFREDLLNKAIESGKLNARIEARRKTRRPRSKRKK